jgi:hypothetical protein
MTTQKIFFSTTFFLFAMFFFTPHASAISLSIGDPVEIFNLWKGVRDQLNGEYERLEQDIADEGKASWAQFNNVLALIKQLGALSEKFSTIINVSDRNKIEVIYPNGGETLECNKKYTITWDIKIAPDQTSIDALKKPTVGIYLSAGNEFGFIHIVDKIVDNLTANVRKYDWTVPCDLRSSAYFMRIRANPDLKIIGFEDISDASFSIISSIPEAIIDSAVVDKISAESGETINMNWLGTNVEEYRLYFGTEFGTSASMDGKGVSAKVVPMGLQTSASFSYINTTDTPKKVLVTLEVYGAREYRDAFKSIEITINPQ